MYSSIEPDTDVLAMSFCTEAEKLWAIERNNERDSLMNVAAAEFLCLGYLGQGRDHAILAYVSEAADMGTRLGLFSIEAQDPEREMDNSFNTKNDATRARAHAAWGVFNWITLSHPAGNFRQLHP